MHSKLCTVQTSQLALKINLQSLGFKQIPSTSGNLCKFNCPPKRSAFAFKYET